MVGEVVEIYRSGSLLKELPAFDPNLIVSFLIIVLEHKDALLLIRFIALGDDDLFQAL